MALPQSKQKAREQHATTGRRAVGADVGMGVWADGGATLTCAPGGPRRGGRPRRIHSTDHLRAWGHREASAERPEGRESVPSLHGPHARPVRRSGRVLEFEPSDDLERGDGRAPIVKGRGATLCALSAHVRPWGCARICQGASRRHGSSPQRRCSRAARAVGSGVGWGSLPARKQRVRMEHTWDPRPCGGLQLRLSRAEGGYDARASLPRAPQPRY